MIASGPGAGASGAGASGAGASGAGASGAGGGGASVVTAEDGPLHAYSTTPSTEYLVAAKQTYEV